MQILNLDADLNISRLDADIRTLRLGEGGTTNYNDLTNKPSINSVVLTGNKTTSDLNIKTSDLINDEGFITNADIPSKTSDLINDSGFQTAAQVSTAVAAAIPTNVSAFTNDAGYITAAQVGNIPTKTSDLTNDSGFITSAQAPVQSVNGYTGAVSLDGSNLDYDAGNSINDKIDEVEAAIPTKTSDLTNDSGFITAAGVPSKTSDLINDSGFITSADIPTDVSAFTNDAGYQTAANVNSLIQAAMPTTETIENESIASFSDGADNVPVSELIVNITATQAGSGTPSPSNPRSISGWSSVNVVNTPDSEWAELWTIDNNFKGVVNFNQLINENLSHGGTNNANKSYDLTTGVLEVTPIDYSTAAGLYQTRLYQEDHIYLSIGDIRPDNRGQFLFGIEGASIITRIIEGGIYTRIYNLAKATATPQSLVVYYYPRGSQGIIWSSGGFKLKNVNVFDLTQLFGDTIANYIYDLEQSHAGDGVAFFRNLYPNDYYDYDSGSIELVGGDDKVVTTISLGDTYYGGTLNVTTGELTVTSGYIASYNGEAINEPWISSIDEYVPNTSPSTGAEVVYPLTTPITVQLTPTEVRTLLGNNNNIFADTGNINELVYFKTGCEAIARLIEAYK